jgi:hypothetical protein
MYYQSPLMYAVLEMYEDMVKNYIAPMFKDDVIVYQKRPTFRVQLPNNTAVPSDLGASRCQPGPLVVPSPLPPLLPPSPPPPPHIHAFPPACCRLFGGG